MEIGVEKWNFPTQLISGLLMGNFVFMIADRNHVCVFVLAFVDFKAFPLKCSSFKKNFVQSLIFSDAAPDVDGFHVYKVIKAIKCLKFPSNFSE